MQINKHIPVLDTLRGIAAMSVCLYHFICTTINFIDNKTLLTVFDNGKLDVHMFFIISGFVIPWSMFSSGYTLRSFFRFLFKRFIRLEPPYIASILLALTVLILKNNIPGLGTPEPIPSASRIFLHLGYVIPFVDGYSWINQVYWTLAIEFQYYLSIALLFPLLIHPMAWFRFVFYGAAIAPTFTTGPAFLPHWLPVFLLGILVFLKFSERISDPEFYIVSAVAFGAICYNIEIASMLVCLFTYCMILMFTNFSNGVTRFFGNISYSIYLIHPLVGASLVNYFSHRVDTSTGKLLVVLIGVAATVLSSYIMYLLIERPSKKISSKIKWKKE